MANMLQYHSHDYATLCRTPAERTGERIPLPVPEVIMLEKARSQGTAWSHQQMASVKDPDKVLSHSDPKKWNEFGNNQNKHGSGFFPSQASR